jgi:hypothetical protein
MKQTEKNKAKFPVIYTMIKWISLLFFIMAFLLGFNVQEYFVLFLVCLGIGFIGMFWMLYFEFIYDSSKFRRSVIFLLLFIIIFIIFLKLIINYDPFLRI